MTTKKKPPMTASEMGKLRWKGLTKAQRTEIARAGGIATREARKAALIAASKPDT